LTSRSKCCGRHFSEDPELVGRFQREADAIASIDHPNVVKVLDHGSADGSHYIAMELIEGPTLQQLIRDRGRLSEEDARYLGEQIAAGLAAAHARGVIHRDLKPANVLVDAAGTAKVSDFGIAHLASMTQLTRTGEVLGTPRYIAPEQVAGKVDARTDVYALGLVLYELVTGAPAFDGETSFQIVRKQLREKPPSLRAAAPSVSRRFENVVTRALQKDPAKRFASAAAMRDALARPVAAPVTAIAARGRRAAAGSAPWGRSPLRCSRSSCLPVSRSLAALSSRGPRRSRAQASMRRHPRPQCRRAQRHRRRRQRRPPPHRK